MSRLQLFVARLPLAFEMRNAFDAYILVRRRARCRLIVSDGDVPEREPSVFNDADGLCAG